MVVCGVGVLLWWLACVVGVGCLFLRCCYLWVWLPVICVYELCAFVICCWLLGWLRCFWVDVVVLVACYLWVVYCGCGY